MVIDHLKLNNQSRFGDLTIDLLVDLDIGVKYSNYFMLDLLDAWNSDIAVSVKGTNQFITWLTFLIIITILVFYAISEKLVAGSLDNYYKFFRKLFNLQMPQEVLIYEKRIKAKLV